MGKDEPSKNDELLTVKEVAKILKFKERTVYNLAKRGDLPVCEIGRSNRFERRDVDDFVKRSKKNKG